MSSVERDGVSVTATRVALGVVSSRSAIDGSVRHGVVIDGAAADDATEDAVEVSVLKLEPDVPMPKYALPGDAGADLACAEDIILAPGERALVRTGIAIALPHGYAAFVHPRSGLAMRVGLGLVNSPGTIDPGYRGEIKLILINHDPTEPIALSRGDRVAQLVVQKVEHARFTVVAELPDSVRGSGGHGSTGTATQQRGRTATQQPGRTATQEQGDDR
jgi:dUTP pyrophosphatase